MPESNRLSSPTCWKSDDSDAETMVAVDSRSLSNDPGMGPVRPLLLACAQELVSTGIMASLVGSLLDVVHRGLVDETYRDLATCYVPDEPKALVDLIDMALDDHNLIHVAGTLNAARLRLQVACRLTLGSAAGSHSVRRDQGAHPMDSSLLLDAWRRASLSLIVANKAVANLLQTFNFRDPALAKISLLLKAFADGHAPCVNDWGNISVPGWAERRKKRRYIRNEPVIVVAGRTRLSAKMRDISAAGACLLSISELRTGDQVLILTATEREFSGQVVWVRDSKYGVRFARPLDDSDPYLRDRPISELYN